MKVSLLNNGNVIPMCDMAIGDIGVVVEYAESLVGHIVIAVENIDSEDHTYVDLTSSNVFDCDYNKADVLIRLLSPTEKVILEN